jgi:hypothetical protein
VSVEVFCLCEGYSEMNFVQRMLAPHLATRNIFIYAPMVMTGSDKRRGMKHKGGGTFQHWHRDLENLWKQNGHRPGIHLTTMLDFFRIDEDFPGLKSLSENMPFREKVAFLENRFAHHGSSHLGIQPDRFSPYISTHEFETMVFTDLEALGTLFLGKGKAIARLKEDVAKIADIEAINGTPQGAPSKRIGKHIPIYEKYKRSDQSGIVNVLEVIGLPAIREACQHLNEWISQLENLGSSLN